MAAAKNEREGLKHDYRKLGVVGDIRGGSGRRSRESGGRVFGLLGSSIDLQMTLYLRLAEYCLRLSPFTNTPAPHASSRTRLQNPCDRRVRIHRGVSDASLFLLLITAVTLFESI
jgi:hypothetical protein